LRTSLYLSEKHSQRKSVIKWNQHEQFRIPLARIGLQAQFINIILARKNVQRTSCTLAFFVRVTFTMEKLIELSQKSTLGSPYKDRLQASFINIILAEKCAKNKHSSLFLSEEHSQRKKCY
jgi:hypothetical protein